MSAAGARAPASASQYQALSEAATLYGSDQTSASTAGGIRRGNRKGSHYGGFEGAGGGGTAADGDIEI